MTSSQPELAAALERRLGDISSPSVAAALVSAEGIVWQACTGTAAPSSGRVVDSQTAFLWFSMTKIATATATMQLVDSGEVGLDSKARDYLPQLDSLDARITIRQLLNHSSGIPNPPPLRWIHPADHPGPKPREMVSRLLDRYGRPRFEPGDHSSYSNIGYLVLGEVIAELSGLPYKQYVHERILRPIGAISTGFSFDVAGAAHASEGAHPRRDPAAAADAAADPELVFGPGGRQMEAVYAVLSGRVRIRRAGRPRWRRRPSRGRAPGRRGPKRTAAPFLKERERDATDRDRGQEV